MRQDRQMKFDLEHKESYRKLNSVKVRWGSGSTFTRELLQIIFKPFGPIKEIVVMERKPKAIVEFHTSQAADGAVASCD